MSTLPAASCSDPCLKAQVSLNPSTHPLTGACATSKALISRMQQKPCAGSTEKSESGASAHHTQLQVNSLRLNALLMHMLTIWYALRRVCRQRTNAPLCLRLPHIHAVAVHLAILSLIRAAAF